MYTTYSINGLNFESINRGPDSAAPVVLLHGFPEDATSWSGVSENIVTAGYRTIAPNLRGYSAGTRTGHRTDYSISTLVDDVVALIELVGSPAHVVGHDWGGTLLWALRKARPDLLASATVVSSPHPTALGWAMTHGYEQPLKSWYIGATALPVLPELFLKHRLASFLENTGLPRDRARYYQERAREPEAASSMLAWYRQMIIDRLPGKAHDQTKPSRPGASAVTTSYVWGTDDRFLGPTAAHKTGERHDIALTRFVEGGHWLPETNPRDVSDIILATIARSDS